MCLIVLAWRVHPDFPLIVAANRDEFHARPAARAAFWDDHPQILAGRDLEARGTWMGVSRGGKFAAVTNYRGGTEPRAIESRGALVSRFLNEGAPGAYIRGLKTDLYSGFNLLAADGEELWWMSNRGGEPRRLSPASTAWAMPCSTRPRSTRSRRPLPPTSKAARRSSRCSPCSIRRASSTRNTARAARPSSCKGERTRYAERSFAPDGADGDTLHYEF